MASSTSAVGGYKPPFIEDVGERTNHNRESTKPSIPYSSSLHVIKDPNLQEAIIAARPTITESWLENELKDAKVKDLEVYRKRLSSDEQITKISSAVLNEWKRGKRKTSGEIAAQIRSHDEVIEFFVEHALDMCMLKIESPQRDAREEIERILNVQKEHGNEYQILGIDKKITRSQLLQKRREILLAVHPDKNEDPDANNCAQG